MKNIALAFVILLGGCEDTILNNPYPISSSKKKILYSSFSNRPKTLDPSISYSSNEAIFISQIYEPIIQYHYLKRPLELVPLTAKEMPKITYQNKFGEVIKSNETSMIKYTVYTLKIKEGILYQPHPAFAKDNKGKYIYHNVDSEKFDDLSIQEITDFKLTGTRELVASDYIYAIKRLAHPFIKSPIYGIMSKHIVGFAEYGKKLANNINYSSNLSKSLKSQSISGVKLIDRYTLEIKVNGIYPQFIYWLAMNFFAPIPWEGDVFYDNEYLKDKNLIFAWYPIGTGPYMLTVNNPNSKMILQKNPNFRGEVYPQTGEKNDHKQGLLDCKNQIIPFVDEVVYSLEKETIPRWNKFLQGYYDFSSISSDSFDEAIKVNLDGKPKLTTKIKEKGIELQTSIAPTIFYLGFNMSDSLVGSNSERAKKLRRAISIAINFDEYITIFLNGRGVIATGPVPPIILNSMKANRNEFIFDYIQEKPIRKSIKDARKILEESGYKDGIDPQTGLPLILSFDVPVSGGADDKERFNWMRKQFNKLGISLNINATHYNRFQDKMRNGNVQIFMSGWHADYPDPENFLFLFYSKNSRMQYGGENYCNYSNKKFDILFEKMQRSINKQEREKLSMKMISILQQDAPWVWGFFPKTYILSHQWNNKSKPSEIAYNTLKYRDVDVSLRNDLRRLWNKPNWTPILIIIGGLLIFIIPVISIYIRRKYSSRFKRD